MSGSAQPMERPHCNPVLWVAVLGGAQTRGIQGVSSTSVDRHRTALMTARENLVMGGTLIRKAATVRRSSFHQSRERYNRSVDAVTLSRDHLQIARIKCSPRTPLRGH